MQTKRRDETFDFDFGSCATDKVHESIESGEKRYVYS